MPFPASSFVRAGRFADVRLIGRGAGGQVYYASDNLGRAVAVKEALPSSRYFHDLCDKLHKEARIQAALLHPNIVHVYHLEEDPESHERYLICEYVPGGSLADHLRDHGPLAPDEAITVALDLCRALDATAAQRIVHRDIKPSNILLVKDEQGRITAAKLGDFGVAQDRSQPPTTLLPGMAHHPGTPEYMAPEQADITRPVDARTDLYALGITLWEMLTGTDYKLLFDHSAPPDLAAYCPRAAPGLSAIIAQATQDDRLLRYPTPQAMASELAEVRDGRWKRTRSTMLLAKPAERAWRAARPAERARESQYRTDAPGPRRPGLSALMLALAVAALALTGFLAFAARLPGQLPGAPQPSEAAFPKPIPDISAKLNSAKLNPALLKALAVAAETKSSAPSCFSPAPAQDQSYAVAPAPSDDAAGDVAKGAAQLARWDSDMWPLGVGFGPDGQMLAAGVGDGAIQIRRVDGGALLRTLCSLASPNPKIAPTAFAFDGRTVGLATSDGALALWSASDGTQLRVLAGLGDVTSIALAADGQTVATATSDGDLTLWRMSDGARLRSLQTKGAAVGLALSADGSTVAAALGEGEAVQLWATGDAARVLVLASGEVAESLALSPEGQILAVGTASGPIRLWSLKDAALVGVLSGHTQGVLGLAFAPGGATLASASEDRSLRLWGAPR